MDDAKWFLFDSAERNSYWSAVEALVEDDDGDFLPNAAQKTTMFWMAAQTNRPAPDLFFAPGSYYVLSETLRSLVAGFRLPQDAVWKQVEIRYRNGVSAQHFCLILPTNLNILNRELSDFKWLVPNKVVGKVKKWILKARDLPSLDLFNAECQNWICSRILRDAIVASGLASVQMSPLETD